MSVSKSEGDRQRTLRYLGPGLLFLSGLQCHSTWDETLQRHFYSGLRSLKGAKASQGVDKVINPVEKGWWKPEWSYTYENNRRGVS